MTAEEKLFRDPATGETMRFSHTGAATGGELLEMQTTYRPYSARPPAHYHPHQREHFEIVEGALTVELNGTQRVYQAGEAFDVPQGAVHAMWNTGDSMTRVIWQIRPALNSQAFFETIWGLRQDGKAKPDGSPGLLQIAVLMQAHQNEIRLASLPPFAQTILFGLLAFIGRLAGYRPHYAASSGSHEGVNNQPPIDRRLSTKD
jgi:quercetin dioxygenase-like cupin family protein